MILQNTAVRRGGEIFDRHKAIKVDRWPKEEERVALCHFHERVNTEYSVLVLEIILTQAQLR